MVNARSSLGQWKTATREAEANVDSGNSAKKRLLIWFPPFTAHDLLHRNFYVSSCALPESACRPQEARVQAVPLPPAPALDRQLASSCMVLLLDMRTPGGRTLTTQDANGHELTKPASDSHTQRYFAHLKACALHSLTRAQQSKSVLVSGPLHSAGPTRSHQRGFWQA